MTVCIRCVGETDAEKAPSSRKCSLQSKQSKQSRLLTGRMLKSRGRLLTSNDPSPTLVDGVEEEKNMDTALAINPKEQPSLPSTARERSSSPPPVNARILLFEFGVIDTGPGIPVSQQRKVFEPFVQGDLGLSKKYGGTGLGLSICSQLASLMKGSISLKSSEGEGSTFTMIVPLK